MTLAQIMLLALRQLDEDPQDISEYDDMFREYANIGYHIAISEYVKPRDRRDMRSDKDGIIYIDSDVRRVVSLERARDRRDVMFELSETGDSIRVADKDERFLAVCEIREDAMQEENDEPTRLPPHAHSALADYICYRHLSNGNMAKQAKAQFYLQQFYQAMQRIRPQGMGSVTGFKNLYTVTDIRYAR